MKSTRMHAWFALVVVGIVFGLGCPQGGTDRPATAPVTGTVTLDGATVEGATITFLPTGTGKSASGVTDASGKYELSTFGGGDGAVPGGYNVKIVKYEGGAAPAATPGEEGEADPETGYEEAYGGAVEGGAEAAEPENLLPEKYADPATSGLTATVDEGENTINFELEG